MIRLLDRLTLFCMGLGVCAMLQPWWAGGFRAGFFLTLAAVAAQIVTSHLLPSAPREDA